MRADRGNFTLRYVPLFDALAADDLNEIEQRCNWRIYEAGEEILSYLDASDEVYFVVSGKAKVIIYSVQGRPVGFRNIVPGDIFGEYAAIDGGSRSASIEAEARCIIAVMSSDDFNDLITNDPNVSRALILHLTKQLRVLTRRVYEFSTLAVNNRIQAEILRLARKNSDDGSTENKPRHISPAPTHAAIAARVSTHREAVTRHLSRLAKSGIIKRKGRSLIILDIQRLERLVRDATGE